VGTVKVEGVTPEELKDVVDKIPKLKYLSTQEHLQELLRRPPCS
jgi:hypothetical protein